MFTWRVHTFFWYAMPTRPSTGRSTVGDNHLLILWKHPLRWSTAAIWRIFTQYSTLYFVERKFQKLRHMWRRNAEQIKPLVNWPVKALAITPMKASSPHLKENEANIGCSSQHDNPAKRSIQQGPKKLSRNYAKSQEPITFLKERHKQQFSEFFKKKSIWSIRFIQF